ncbi:hypothetical protein CspeluHIS016_0304170 [Cutaneotrichosporon spelunceum]|uniref:Integral membrane protein n=1 Tax=Cutaneotrichosporon spelunceum TaxID=1672016 RepID=A0AAD3TU52_9TREE|nr:hypothetical protein CspeluHIS016_0304170 [Cutaneotrichosporon spelunceum]
MGQVQSAFDPDKGSRTPDSYVVPPFPSLYNPSIVSTRQQRGYFLPDATSIWKFTFYWTLILMSATFEACAALAVFAQLLSRSAARRRDAAANAGRRSKFRLRRRSPLYFLLLIPIAMGAIATFVSLVSGTVVGFALAAVYNAGGFAMSTWVPFMWGMIQVVVLIIASYSSLTRVL